MAALCRVQILAANGAETQTIRATDGLDGELEQHVFAHQRAEINVGIVWQDQAAFSHRFARKSVEFGKINFQMQVEFGQAAHTFGMGHRAQACLDQQTLRRARYAHRACQGSQV